jgi:hypothetical protein
LALAGGLALALTGRGQPGATDAEKAAARRPWMECVIRAIARLDDGKSDPASISYGIAPVCAVEHEHLTETYLKGVTSLEARIYLHQLYEDTAAPSITTAVLTYRVAENRHSMPPQ